MIKITDKDRLNYLQELMDREYDEGLCTFEDMINILANADKLRLPEGLPPLPPLPSALPGREFSALIATCQGTNTMRAFEYKITSLPENSRHIELVWNYHKFSEWLQLFVIVGLFAKRIITHDEFDQFLRNI